VPPIAGSPSLVIRKVIWSTVTEVGIGDDVEPHRPDRRRSIKQRASDAMHTVHHTAVGANDDRIREVHLLNQPDVLDDLADGSRIALVEPLDRVELPDRAEVDLVDIERGAESDETIDIPGVEAVLTGPQVVLLAHTNSLVVALLEDHPLSLDPPMN